MDRIAFYCDGCGEPIIEGDNYYAVEDERYCADCVEEKKAGEE